MSFLPLRSQPSPIFWNLQRFKKFLLSSSPVLLHRIAHGTTITRTYSAKMSTESTSNSQLTQTINLPRQPCQAVQVIAAPGVSESDFRNAIESSLFKQWLKNIQTETGLLANGDMLLKQVLVQNVDMFGKRVGFLKFKADIIDKETGKKKVRVPVGRLILELPAGMLDDDSGDFLGTAVREVEEEIGINLNADDMIDLTQLLDPSTGCRTFPSPGGCDEEISLFLYRGNVSKEVITGLQGKQTGLRDHGELIKVHVVPYEKLWRTTADAKALMAIALYEMAKKDGLLPPLKD